MDEEERQGLTDFRRHADLSCVTDLGCSSLQFESEHLTGDGVKPVDRDVDAYVLENG